MSYAICIDNCVVKCKYDDDGDDVDDDDDGYDGDGNDDGYDGDDDVDDDDFLYIMFVCAL